MKDEVTKVKIPHSEYKRLQKMAEVDHRTLHSLMRHVLIKFANGELVEVRNDKP